MFHVQFSKKYFFVVDCTLIAIVSNIILVASLHQGQTKHDE